MTRFCAKQLTCLFALAALVAGLAPNHAAAQATLDNARPQFGASTYKSPAASAASAAQMPQPATAAEAGWPQQPPTGISQPSGFAGLSGGAADPDKKFGIGDIVSFSIVEDRDPTIFKRVTDTGEIDFPYIGRVSAVGKNASQVAAEVKRKLEAEYYYKATVKLGLEQTNNSVSRGKIYVIGHVRSPGPQDVFPGEQMTASAAIIKAGGFDQFAWKSRVRVSRKSKNGKTEQFIVNVGAVLQKGSREKDLELQDGDYVYVPQAIVTFSTN